jgi:crotonobetainyl-CoA:carnitine CoA-transferase CaiB-like acyl-CoA transferase
LASPLAGIRVIDLTRWLAGPFATSMLGDMGADVIKVEKPGQGDGTRGVDQLFVDHLSSYHLGLNRNKRSLALDISKPAGQDIVRRLALTADVLIENFRPDVMPRLGLAYEELSVTNPRLIYCSISSFGAEGPLRKKAGMDLVVQAMGGVMGLTGESGGLPFRVGAPIADFVGAYQAVMGVTLALLARHQSGLGQKVDVALLDGQISMLANYIPGFFVTGEPSGPVGVGHPQLVPYQPFAAADGRIIIACLTEEFWRRLCRALQLDGLIDDVRFRRNSDRVANRGELIPTIEAAVARFTTAELAGLLDEADVPNAPVWSLAELLEHPQVATNEMVLHMEHPRAGRYRAVGMPVKLRGTPGVVRRPAAELGQDSKDILTEAGIDEDAYKRLLDEGIVGEWNPET